MKRTLISTLVAAVLLVVIGQAAQATEVGYGRKFGLGFVLGSPTGLSAKLWVAPTNAIDFGLGFWGYGFRNHCWVDDLNRTRCDGVGYSSWSFNADYLWQSNIVRGTAQLDWHIGAGGRFAGITGCAGDCFWAAARVPIGLDLMFANPSFLEIFFELVPSLYLVPTAWFDIEGALGVRFYF